LHRTGSGMGRTAYSLFHPRVGLQQTGEAHRERACLFPVVLYKPFLDDQSLCVSLLSRCHGERNNLVERSFQAMPPEKCLPQSPLPRFGLERKSVRDEDQGVHYAPERTCKNKSSTPVPPPSAPQRCGQKRLSKRAFYAPPQRLVSCARTGCIGVERRKLAGAHWRDTTSSPNRSSPRWTTPTPDWREELSNTHSHRGASWSAMVRRGTGMRV
jgi:hypothetical protein